MGKKKKRQEPFPFSLNIFNGEEVDKLIKELMSYHWHYEPQIWTDEFEQDDLIEEYDEITYSR